MTVRTSLSRGVLRLLLRRLWRTHLVITWSNDRVDVFAGESASQVNTMTVADESRLLRGLIEKGSLGFGASYIEGAWDTRDLPGLLEMASRAIDQRQERAVGRFVIALGRRFWDRLPHRFWRSPIEEMGIHYDLGNDFYAAWLDDSMTYSSAIFDADTASLEAAQNQKYERLCALLDLRQGDRVLEIGCGWGGFAHYAATRYDVEVTGLTLSKEMADYARKRLAQAGLAHQTEVKVQDFRDERDIYDKVVSIEMIESISADQWPDLFATISRVIRPGGIVAMQAIVIDDRYHEQLIQRDEFIKTYIFPGGDLPTSDGLRSLVDTADLEWGTEHTHGEDYAETLARWAAAFDSAWDAIAATDPALDVRFKRMWEYYLAYCEAGFRTGRLDGVQFSATSVH